MAKEMIKKLKRGDARENGKIFWRYIKGHEYWVSPFVFEHLKKKETIYRTKHNAKRD